MIIRNRRKRSSFFSRVSRAFSRITPPAGYQQIQPTENFQQEIDKEIQRSNRRKVNPEFAIVTIDFSDHKVSDDQLDWLVDEFVGRLRVSDTIGWHEMKLAVLLPETDSVGAQLVCDSLVGIANKVEIELETRISIYPWDDKLLGENQQRFDEHESIPKGPNYSRAERTTPAFDGLKTSVSGGAQTCVLERTATSEKTTYER